MATEVGIRLREVPAFLGCHAGDCPQGAMNREPLRTHIPMMRCPDALPRMRVTGDGSRSTGFILPSLSLLGTRS